jgi:hypothetical protein
MMNHCTRSTAVRLSALETFGFTLAGSAVLAILENWRNQSPTTRTDFFRWIAPSLVSYLNLNRLVPTLMPRESRFQTPLEKRSQGEPHCFRDTHNQLLAAREQLLPWLLMATYSEHPPAAAEAYRFLKLGDIQKVLEKLASVLGHGARCVDQHMSCYDRSRFIEQHETQVNFLLDQLTQYGIEADTYAEAVQKYVKFIDSIFPASAHVKAPGGEVTTLVSTISDEAGL